MAKLSLRIDIEPAESTGAAAGRIGPGKVALLEAIQTHRSIAAAGRSMGMSYRRAWELVDAVNRCFGQPVVQTQMGGRSGGGATLTGFGREMVERYRQMEAAAQAAVDAHLLALQGAVRTVVASAAPVAEDGTALTRTAPAMRAIDRGPAARKTSRTASPARAAAAGSTPAR